MEYLRDVHKEGGGCMHGSNVFAPHIHLYSCEAQVGMFCATDYIKFI